MPTFNPRLFSEPDRLKTIKPARLITFLSTFSAYLAVRGFPLPDAAGAGLDYPRLAAILMHPDDQVPRAMVDALYYVHEMSDEDAFDDLLALAHANGVALEADVSPGDVAVELWLQAPQALQKAHTETATSRLKSFTYFSGRTGAPRTFPAVPATQLKALEADLDHWFAAHRRGRGCRVLVYDRGPKVWIAIRHGQPFRREGSLHDDGQSGIEYYRPERHDVLIYDTETDDIAVHATTKGETNLYLELIGRHIFGDADYFPGAAKFTLEPLLQDGEAGLNCEDVPGLEWVRLTEYHQVWEGAWKERQMFKATDVFQALTARGRSVAPDGRLIKGVFSVKFVGVKKPRTVTIRPSNIATYERDSDSELVEIWLRRRGFILAGADETDEPPPAILAVA